MTWSSLDWTATEAVVGRIQDRIFRAAKIKRPRLEPDDEQSSCPVLGGWVPVTEPGYPTSLRRSPSLWRTQVLQVSPAANSVVHRFSRMRNFYGRSLATSE